MSRREDLRRAALAIVAQGQPCPPNTLVTRLRNEYGANHAEANRAMLELIRDRRLRRTAFGELILPGGGTGGGSGYPVALKVVGVVLMLAILAFMGWVFYRLATAERGPRRPRAVQVIPVRPSAAIRFTPIG